MMRLLAAALVIAALAPGAATADDYPISGKKLVIAQTAGSALLVFISRDVIRAPLPASADDPRIAGATLVVTSGNTSASATFDLPAATWRMNGSGTVFSYRNLQAPAGPSAVKVARIRNGSLIKVTGKGTGIALNGSQGSIDLVLTSGTRRYCASFGGSIVRDETNRFIARNAPPPAACPGPPPTTSTTNTTVPTTSSSSVSTTTSTTVSTTTSTLAASCPPPATALGNAGFTIVAGTPNCGGPGLVPNSSAPTTGAIYDGNNVKLADLGLGCFYAGDGLSNALPSSQLVSGTKNYLGLGTVNGTAFTLTASSGTGPLDCSRGADFQNQHCYNGAPGTNGMGLCAVDTDCGSDQDYCLPTANCYFGAPIPLRPSSSAFNSCVMQAILTDACGAINLDTASASLSVALGVRMYLTQANPAMPRMCGGRVQRRPAAGPVLQRRLRSRGHHDRVPAAGRGLHRAAPREPALGHERHGRDGGRLGGQLLPRPASAGHLRYGIQRTPRDADGQSHPERSDQLQRRARWQPLPRIVRRQPGRRGWWGSRARARRA
jgi:hypothetical protein